MAVADSFAGFSPDYVQEPKSAVFEQVESKAYSRAPGEVVKLVKDVRQDVDRAFQRAMSAAMQDPSLASAVPIGVAWVDGTISVAASDNTLVLKGDFKAEPGHTSPVAAEATYGTGTSELTYTAKTPGNGNNDYPNGNRILIFHRDPLGNDESLAVTTALVELDGLKYRCIDIALATDSGGVITTTADDIAALTDAALLDWVSVASGGAGLVAAQTIGTEATQLEDGEGGVYDVFYGATGAWVKKQVTTWTDTAVTLADIDGTSGHTAGDTVMLMLVANGIAFIMSVAVYA